MAGLETLAPSGEGRVGVMGCSSLRSGELTAGLRGRDTTIFGERRVPLGDWLSHREGVPGLRGSTCPDRGEGIAGSTSSDRVAGLSGSTSSSFGEGIAGLRGSTSSTFGEGIGGLRGSTSSGFGEGIGELRDRDPSSGLEEMATSED